MNNIKSFLRQCKLIAGLALIGVAATIGLAQTASYESRSDLSLSTNWAETVFPARGNVASVLHGLTWRPESSTQTLHIVGGTQAIPIWYSLNSTQLVISSSYLPLVRTQQWGIISLPNSNATFMAWLHNTNNATNVFIGGPGPVLHAINTTYTGVLTNTNAVLWLCTNIVVIDAPLNPGNSNVITLQLDSAALFSAAVNAPLGIRAGSPTGPAGGTSNQIRRATIERFYPSPGLVQ